MLVSVVLPPFSWACLAYQELESSILLKISLEDQVARERQLYNNYNININKIKIHDLFNPVFLSNRKRVRFQTKVSVGREFRVSMPSFRSL